MRVHYFTGAFGHGSPALNLLVLGPRHRTELLPDPAGRPVRVELEAMAAIEPGVLLMLTAHPGAVLDQGLRPALPVLFRDHRDPDGPLEFWFEPPREPLTIEIGTPVVEIALLSAPLERVYHDPALVDRLASGFGTLETPTDTPPPSGI